ncbi:MAG: hypothetical protein FWG77_05195 [Treponema sp.]|nr:hypothetical protein [Treponema sp.]
MKRAVLWSIVFLMVGTLTSCASLRVSENESLIIVERGTGTVGAAIPIHITVNGDNMGSINAPGRSLRFTVPNGHHTIRARFGAGDATIRELTFTANHQRIIFVTGFHGISGIFNLDLTEVTPLAPR